MSLRNTNGINNLLAKQGTNNGDLLAKQGIKNGHLLAKRMT